MIKLYKDQKEKKFFSEPDDDENYVSDDDDDEEFELLQVDELYDELEKLNAQ